MKALKGTLLTNPLFRSRANSARIFGLSRGCGGLVEVNRASKTLGINRDMCICMRMHLCISYLGSALVVAPVNRAPKILCGGSIEINQSIPKHCWIDCEPNKKICRYERPVDWIMAENSLQPKCLRHKIVIYLFFPLIERFKNVVVLNWF